MGVRICPYSRGHCLCTTPFCPASEREAASGYTRGGSKMWIDANRKELAKQRVADMKGEG